MTETRFYSETRNGVPLLKCSLLTPHHGFAGRRGGVSTLPHLAELNIGDGLGDSAAHVTENLSRLAAAVDARPDRIVRAKQVHDNCVLHVTQSDCGRTDLTCDGFVTDEPDVVLLVKTADCVPILLCDRENGVVAALHAGWRGSVARIAAKGIEAMCEAGADRRTVTAAIGPCIHSCCYSVGDEVIQTFYDVCREDAEACIVQDSGSGQGKLDLAAWNQRVLLREGIAPDHIAVSDLCTCCHTDRFFSHRGMQGKRGVMGAVIRL